MRITYFLCAVSWSVHLILLESDAVTMLILKVLATQLFLFSLYFSLILVV